MNVVSVSAQLCLFACHLLGPHPGDVNLADHVFSSLDVFSRPGDEDAFALAAGVRLTDVGLVLFGPDICMEVTVAAGEDSQIRRKHNVAESEKVLW